MKTGSKQKINKFHNKPLANHRCFSAFLFGFCFRLSKKTVRSSLCNGFNVRIRFDFCCICLAMQETIFTDVEKSTKHSNFKVGYSTDLLSNFRLKRGSNIRRPQCVSWNIWLQNTFVISCFFHFFSIGIILAQDLSDFENDIFRKCQLNDKIVKTMETLRSFFGPEPPSCFAETWSVRVQSCVERS